MIQSLWRGYCTRCDIWSDVRARKLFVVATKIQTMVRGFLSYWVVEDRRERHAAATSIQTLFRGASGKRDARMKKRDKAATEITRMCRGVMCREKMRRRRRWIAAQFNKEARSTIKLQNAFRMRQAIKRAQLRKETMSKRRNSAMMLQKLIRGRNGRIHFDMKKEFKAKEAAIQGKQRRASTLIQAAARRRAAGHYVSDERKKKEVVARERSASILQSVIRGKQGRRKSSMLRLEYERCVQLCCVL